MRYLIIGFLVIVLAVQGVLLLLFTATGNDMLLPQVNAYLKEDIKKYDIEVSQFRLGLHSLSFVAKVNYSIDLRSQGKVDLLAQTFDMDYLLEAEEIETKKISIKEHIAVKGNVKGHKDDMKITGKGIAFESYVDFDLRKVDEELQDIKITMKKAEISKILAVLDYDVYAQGLLTLEVDMPKFDPEDPQGSAKIFIPHLTPNIKKIAKDFDVQIPPKSLIAVDMLASTKEGKISLEGSVKSNMANLTVDNGSYDPASKAFDVDYSLKVDDLSKLSRLSKKELRGSLALLGKASHKAKSLKVSGSTKSFGGQSRFVYKDDTLDMIFDNIKTETLLYKLGEKPYMSGSTRANIHLSSVKKGTGTFDVEVKGNVNTKVLKQNTKTDLGKTFYTHATLNGKVKEKKIFSKITLNTTMAKIKAEHFVYDMKKRTYGSDYSMDIPDMQKLKPLTKSQLKGDMYLSGEIKKEKDLVVTGHGKEFDGSIDFKLVNDDLKADLTGATASKVMVMMGYPKVIEAITQAKADYNVKKRQGIVHGTLDNARILPSQLTMMLEQFAHMDLAHERFNNSKFTIKIDRDIIKFTLDAKNKRNYIRVKNGILDKRSDMLNADVDVEMEGKDMAATISGPRAHPNVTLNSSVYLEKKINKNLDKLIDKNIKGENAEQIKSLLKGFF